MNDTYSIPLALVDFIPNIAFLIGAYFLVRLVWLEQMRPCGRMLMAGTLLVFLGGIFKAVWKFVYSTGIADLTLLSEIQFVLLAPGFLLMLVAVIQLAQGKKHPEGAMLPAMALWKIPFLVVTTLCSLGAEGILAYISFKRGARWAGYMFAIAVIGLVSMAVMASGEQTIARQWMEEIVNTIGQGSFMIGSYLLYKNYSEKQGAG